MLQGRYGVSGWRRQTRLEAYTSFINASHDFNSCLTDALDAVGSDDSDEKWRKVREAEAALGRAGSLVSMAGPPSIDQEAINLVFITRSIVKECKDPDTLSLIASDHKAGRKYKRNQEWIASAYSFNDTGRKVLRTDEAGRYFRKRANSQP